MSYFERRRQEVEDIMFTLFDQEYETELYKKRIAEEAWEQGLEKGKAQGLEQGLEKGKAQGIEQGIEQGKIAAFASLVDDGVLALEDAASRLGISPERFAELMANREQI